MARYAGKIGYGETSESDDGSGVYSPTITEVTYFGDEVRGGRRLTQGESVNKDIEISATISIVADAHAFNNFTNILYAEWMGKLWTVQTVEVERPRLILYLGEVYNGPTPEPPDAP